MDEVQPRVTRAAAAVLALLLLAGCGGGGGHFTAPSATTTLPPYTPGPIVAGDSWTPDEQAYLEDVRADGLVPRYADDATAIGYGRGICDSFTAAPNGAFIAQNLARSRGIAYTVAETFVYDATLNLCPWHRGR